jgi:hypothetical protein
VLFKEKHLEGRREERATFLPREGKCPLQMRRGRKTTSEQGRIVDSAPREESRISSRRWGSLSPTEGGNPAFLLRCGFYFLPSTLDCLSPSLLQAWCPLEILGNFGKFWEFGF